jgi:hypothetical protein
MLRRIGTGSFLAALSVLLLLAWVGRVRPGLQGLLPRQLTGVWTADDPRYKDRALELSQAFVIVITGRHDAPSVQMVDRVETEPKGEDTVYTIYSTDYQQGTHNTMTVQFRPSNGGEIRFRNQAEVWKRSPELHPIR